MVGHGRVALAGAAHLGQGVELAHQAHVEVDGGVQPAVRVHRLDLRTVLRVLQDVETYITSRCVVSGSETRGQNT